MILQPCTTWTENELLSATTHPISCRHQSIEVSTKS
jgi:hypothetical protein